jgi:ABC-2 type transport system permease protein
MTAATMAAPATQPRVQPPSMLQLVRVELRKTYDTRAGFWLLLVIALAAVAVVTLMGVFADDPDRNLASYLSATQFPVAFLLPVLGILAVTSEWSQRTAMTTFTLVPRRSRVLVAKLVATVLLALAAIAATLVAAALANLATIVFTDAPASWSLEGDLLPGIVLVQVVNIVVGVAFGLMLLSSPLAIVLYFVLPSIFGIIVSLVDALDWVQRWLDLNSTTTPLYDGTMASENWPRLATSLALWLALPLVIGWFRVQRSEVS